MTPFRFIRAGVLALAWFAMASAKMLRRAGRSAEPDANLLHLYGQELWRGWRRILRLDLTIRNEERLTLFQPCVYIANHRSNLDIPALSGVLPPRTVVIVKRELLKAPFLGKMLLAGQTIIINRKDRNDAHAGIALAEAAIRQSRVSIWVFPEGTRNHGTPLPFKKGAFHLARNAGVNLIPLVHATSPGWVDKRRLFVRKRTKVLVEVLEPIDPSSFPTTNACVQHAQKVMAEALSRVEAEVALEN